MNDKLLNRKYFNLPQSFKLEDYRIATDKFIEKYSKHPDVVSIFLFGQVSVVGISDLDFIVVFKEPVILPVDEEISISSFNRNLRYLYNDTQPFLMNQEVFKSFWKIFPTSGLKLVYGEEIKQNIRDAYEKTIYSTLILIDMCNYFYPIVFLKQIFSNSLNVRFSLLILNSLKFPLKIFMQLKGMEVAWWIDFMDRVEDLRKKWFKKDFFINFKELNRLLEEASKVSLDLIDKLNSYIKDHFWDFPLANKEGVVGRLGSYHFATTFNKDSVLKDITDSFNREAKWLSFLPATFFYPLISYSEERGVVSRYIRRNLSIKVERFNVTDERILKCIKDRINLMNMHASFYIDNKIQINMVHNYYNYNPLKERRKILFSVIFFFDLFYNRNVNM